MAGRIIPNIVRDGLIHYSDVANTKFYAGGTSVYSLLTGGTGTLEFSSGVTGGTLDKSFLLDGINDKVILNNSYTRPVYSLPITLDMWVNVDPGCTNLNMIFSTSEDSFYRGASLQVISISQTNFGFALSYYDGSGGIGAGNRRSFITTDDFELDKWYHITGSIIDSETANFYCNGYQYPISISGDYMGTGLQISNDFPACVGKANGYSYFFKGKVSNIKVYDRVLTKDESIKNFNAHKKRYNL